MEKIALLGIFCAVLGSVSGTNYPCGTGDSWVPYKDETCIRVLDADEYGLQTKDDAEVLCATIDRGLVGDRDAPGLLNIKTEGRQENLKNFLFDYDVIDPIWLSLSLNEDNVLRWDDDTPLYYSNLTKDGTSDPNLRCVQMDPTSGQWLMVSCEKKNAVVCEKMQRWSVQSLLQAYFSLHLEYEVHKDEQDQAIKALQTEVKNLQQGNSRDLNSSLESDVKTLQQNPVPIGFMYFQLPYMSKPSVIWPQVTWREVSDWYAGDFFRVVGGEAAEFGQEQDGNSPHLDRVELVSEAENKWLASNVPSSGSWGGPVSLGWRADGNQWRGLKFRISSGEVRPLNMAIRVWQRLN